MYKEFYGLEFNPFSKELDTKKYFNSNDFTQVTGRLEHLKNIKGLGLITGSPGTGKTYSIRHFLNSLNPSLYKVSYTALSTLTVLEFYKSLAYGLGIDPANKKVDIFRQIQDSIITFSKEKKITPVIVVDESQHLKVDVLNDLKILLNFNIDSSSPAILILAGQPVLNNTLSRNVHDPLAQRIVINYNFKGLTNDEIKEYIQTRLKIAGVNTPIFNENALEVIASSSNGSVRKVNNLVENCLLAGFNQKQLNIDEEIVYLAKNEIDLI